MNGCVSGLFEQISCCKWRSLGNWKMSFSRRRVFLLHLQKQCTRWSKCRQTRRTQTSIHISRLKCPNMMIRWPNRSCHLSTPPTQRCCALWAVSTQPKVCCTTETRTLRQSQRSHGERSAPSNRLWNGVSFKIRVRLAQQSNAKFKMHTGLDGQRRHQRAYGRHKHTNQTRIFASNFLRQQSTGYVRHDVAPIERRQNQPLQALRPVVSIGWNRMHGDRRQIPIGIDLVFEWRTYVRITD